MGFWGFGVDLAWLKFDVVALLCGFQKVRFFLYPSGKNINCGEKIYDKIKLDIKMAVIVNEAKWLDVYFRDDEATLFDALKNNGNMIFQVSNGGVQN